MVLVARSPSLFPSNNHDNLKKRLTNQEVELEVIMSLEDANLEGNKDFCKILKPFWRDGFGKVEIRKISVCDSHLWAGAKIERQPPAVIGGHGAQPPCGADALTNMFKSFHTKTDD